MEKPDMQHQIPNAATSRISCPQCGQQLASDVIDGLCPSCLLDVGYRFALDTNSWYSTTDSPIGNRISTSLDSPDNFGNYELLDEIGRGGMGVVYRARQLKPNRIVAVKMVLAGQLASPEEVKRFFTEADAVGKLDHPGIVRVFEAGEHDGIHYIAMEYVPGHELGHRVLRGPLSSDETVKLTHAVAEAVAHAHKRGVIHRDLKPSNILLDHGDNPRVMDFGLAKCLENDQQLTVTGTVLGTAAFMPPEQAEGNLDKTGTAADVYSLGAIMYTLLTSRPPFHGKSALETMRLAREQEPVAPHRWNNSIPRDLETICLKCLEKDPGKRYPTAGELRDDLGRFLAGKPVLARPVTRLERCWRWSRRNPLVSALTAALVLCIVVGLSIVAVQYARAAAANAAEKMSNAARDLFEAETKSRSDSHGRHWEILATIKKSGAQVEHSALRNHLTNLAIKAFTIPCDVNVTSRIPFREFCRVCTVDPALKRFARADNDLGIIRLGRLSDGKFENHLPRPGDGFGEAKNVKFSPDGRFLAVQYGRSTFQVWDLRSDPVACFAKPQVFRDIDFHPTEPLLVAAVGNTEGSESNIQFFELPSGDPVRSWTFPRTINLLRCDPTGEKLLVVQNARKHRAVVVEADTGKEIARLRKPDANVIDAAFSPDGRLIAFACPDDAVYLVKPALGGIYRTLIHDQRVQRVRFNHTGDVLATSTWDGRTNLWEPITGNLITVCNRKFVRFGKDDRQLVLQNGKELSTWDLSRSRIYRALYAPGRYDSPGPFEVSFLHHDNRLLMLSSGAVGVDIWDTATRKIIGQIPTPETIRSVIAHPSGSMLITSSDLTGVSRWPLHWNDNELTIGPREILHAPGPVRQGFAALSHDGETLAAIVRKRTGGPRHVCVVPMKNPQTKRFIRAQPGVAHISLDPTGRWLATGAWHGFGLILWDLKNGDRKTNLLPLGYNVNARFSPDGKWLMVNTENEYQLLQTGTWRKERVWPVSKDRSTIGFSPDGKQMVISRDRWTLQLIDIETWQETASFEPPRNQLHRFAAFSPDGSLLAVSGDHVINLWDIGQTAQELRGAGLDWKLDLIQERKPPSRPTRVTVVPVQ